jgi:hypothetical protein
VDAVLFAYGLVVLELGWKRRIQSLRPVFLKLVYMPTGKINA